MNGKNTDKSNSIFGNFSEDENDESKQVSVTEFTGTTNAIGGWNQNEKSVNELSKASPNNSLSASLQFTSNMRQIFSKNVTNNSPLSIDVKTNINQSAQISTTQTTEVAKPTYEKKPELIDDELETVVDFSQSNDEQLFLKTSMDNSLSVNSSNAQNKQLSIIQSCEGNDSSIQNHVELLKTHQVSDMLFSDPIIHRGTLENEKTLFQSNSSNNASHEIIDQVIPSEHTESNYIKEFLCNPEGFVLPNQFWISMYNSTENSAVFIERDENMKTIKSVYFRNSFVPNIRINKKPYEFKRAVKTKNELENLLEEIDDIIICEGNNEYPFNETCIGYYKSTSIDIIECENCQLKDDMVKKDIASKTIKIMENEKNIAELKIKASNIIKQLQQASKDKS